MSEDNGQAFIMPKSYNVNVAAFKRFEQRSGVKLFAALAKAMKEAGEAVDGMQLATSVFSDSEAMAAFIYECGLDHTQRSLITFEDFLERITIAQLFEQIDPVIRSLFTSSPFQTTDPETGKEKTTETAEVTSEAAKS